MMNNTQPINILAIETATHACSIALLTKNGLITRLEQEPRAHTRLLLPMIDSVLKESGVNLEEISVFALGAGPGSFTGVRIASSVTQALSFGLNKPIITVSSLRVLAQGIYRKYNKPVVLSRIDARMNEVYWGLYENHQGIMHLKGEETLSSLNSLEQINYPNSAFMCDMEKDLPEAQDLAVIAAAEYELGHVKQAIDAVPLYLRNNI